MDLLCIPQERTALALKEISRQGLIFRRADSVVAWVNDLSGWESLRNAIEWLSLFYLYSRAKIKFCYPQIRPFTPEDHWELRVNSFTNAASFMSTFKPFLSGNVSPWLTSLWTLQEACLRPDMSFCSATWEPLLVGRDTLVTLDTMIVLASFIAVANREGTVANPDRFDMSYSARSRRNLIMPAYTGRNADTGPALHSYKRGRVFDVVLLKSALELSRVWQVNEASPANLLSLGQVRKVTDLRPTARAEAIMSAVGATSWYINFYQRPSHVQRSNLVSGLYPLPFLHELARKQPIPFYWTSTDHLRYLTSSVILGPNTWARAIGPQYYGSMMPFLPDQGQVFGGHLAKETLPRVPDQCIYDWLIQVDGSVLIQECLCLKRVDPRSDPGVSNRVAPFVENGASLTYDTPVVLRAEPPLDQWLNTFYPSTPNYAVALSSLEQPRTTLVLFGILLKRIGFQRDTEILVKIGIFLARNDGSHIFERKKVNWLVI